MNGSQAVIRTLVDAGVDVCFANPGTSEMHVVAALDDVPAMRGVLTLFEGVATGAADGYARMAGRPAATLLHLGPGLANGWANLHNARRARTAVVNLVGDHALTHKRLDAPLESDVDALAGAVGWVRRALSVEHVGDDVADAVAAARAGRVATLLLPADLSWSQGAAPAALPPAHVALAAPPAAPDPGRVIGGETVLLLGGDALTAPSLLAAARIAAGTGARLLAETFPTRMARGAGLPDVAKLPYPVGQALEALSGVHHLVLVGAASPVAFFAYPDLPGSLVPQGCAVHVLTEPGEPALAALEALAGRVGGEPVLAPPARPDVPRGPLTPAALAAVVGAVLPRDTIVVDESISSGASLFAATAGAPHHDVLSLTGGAIGDGLPMAVGAAVACPDRPVLAVQADGAAMYTPQALWTMAREGLDVTVLVCDNGRYAILDGELAGVGATAGGRRAARMLDLGSPSLDFVALAAAMGVPGERARTGPELAGALRRALAEPGPHLVDAVLR